MLGAPIGSDTFQRAAADQVASDTLLLAKAYANVNGPLQDRLLLARHTLHSKHTMNDLHHQNC